MSKRKKNRGKLGSATANWLTSGGVADSPPPLAGGLLRPAGTGRDPRRWKRLLIFAGFVLLAGIGYAGYLAHEEGYWPFVEKPIRGKLLPDGERDGTRLEAPRKSSSRWDKFAEQMSKIPPQKKWDVERWSPVSDDDKLIDRFVRLHSAGDAKAQELLAPLGDKKPTTNAEEERRDAGTLLRMGAVRITNVWRGVPDGDRPPRPAPRRYVLVTWTKEAVTLPSGYRVSYPVVVVEVQGQKIQPLWTAVNPRPE